MDIDNYLPEFDEDSFGAQFPDTSVKRPLEQGEHISFRSAPGRIGDGLGKRRKNNSQGNCYVKDSTGQVWRCKCIQWNPKPGIWEVEAPVSP